MRPLKGLEKYVRVSNSFFNNCGGLRRWLLTLLFLLTFAFDELLSIDDELFELLGQIWTPSLMREPVKFLAFWTAIVHLKEGSCVTGEAVKEKRTHHFARSASFLCRRSSTCGAERFVSDHPLTDQGLIDNAGCRWLLTLKPRSS